MSVTEVQIIREEGGPGQGSDTRTRAYQVQCDDPDTDDMDTALTADDGTTAVADIGDAWKSGHPAKVISKKARPFGEDPLTWEVTVEYSSDSKKQQAAISNPLSRPTRFSYSDGSVAEPYFRDTDSLPVVNSAGEPFADLPQRERAIGTISVTRNVASFNDGTAEAYRDRINTSSVSINGTSYAARTLRITGWTAEGPNEENGVEFWTETITLAKRAETWDHLLEDRGLNYLASGKLLPILDGKNAQVQLPYPLNGSGAKQASPTTAPAQITRKPYTAGSFPSLA